VGGAEVGVECVAEGVGGVGADDEGFEGVGWGGGECYGDRGGYGRLALIRVGVWFGYVYVYV